MRAIESKRNGNPNPSLPPASADMNSRKCRLTYLSANGPLAMACERTGSMQITQDPMIKAANCYGTHEDSHLPHLTGSHVRMIGEGSSARCMPMSSATAMSSEAVGKWSARQAAASNIALATHIPL